MIFFRKLKLDNKISEYTFNKRIVCEMYKNTAAIHLFQNNMNIIEIHCLCENSATLNLIEVNAYKLYPLCLRYLCANPNPDVFKISF